MENVSDINLKHEQYEEHLIVLCVKGSSGLGNSLNHTCLLLLISMLWHRQAIFESKGDKLSSSAESRIRTHQGLRHQIASRLNAHWQTDWAIEDQAKNLNSTARPYDQRASAHLTPQPFGIRTWLWRHTCLLLLISMIWHRQAIFESKGDKLSSSAESRIRTHQGLRHQIASRLNAHWQTDWAIEDQAKNLNSTARPYDQRAFSPLDPTAVWHSHLALAIYMFVVVNFIHTQLLICPRLAWTCCHQRWL